MRETCRFGAGEVEPDRRAVLGRIGRGPRSGPSPAADRLIDRAVDLLRRHSEARGVLEEIPVSEFGEIYRGEGKNVSPAPVEAIHPHAERVGLFAVTLGGRVGDEIASLFAVGEFALGYLLDAVASAAAENAARLAARRFLERLVAGGSVAADRRALDYSPGYCGWDISGQRALFERLRPSEAGIALSASCLMQPLKSVSGAILVGPAEVHRVEPVYPCCSVCADRGCRDRAGAAVAAGDRPGRGSWES